MKQENDPEALGGIELALLSRRDAAHANRISSEAISMLSSGEAHLQDTIYWLLGQFGGGKNLNVLLQAADAADDKGFESIITSLSWSPDSAATPAFLSLVKDNARDPSRRDCRTSGSTAHADRPRRNRNAGRQTAARLCRTNSEHRP